MKKLIALILALVMATALFACTKQKQEEDPSDFQPGVEEDDGGWSIVV